MNKAFTVYPLLEEKYNRKYRVEIDVMFPYISYIDWVRKKNRKTKSLDDVVLFASRKENFTFSDMKKMTTLDLEKLFDFEYAYEIYSEMNKKFTNAKIYKDLFTGFHDHRSSDPENKKSLKNFSMEEEFCKHFMVHAWSHLEYMLENMYFPFFNDNLKIKFMPYHSGTNMFMYPENMEELKFLLEYFSLYQDYFSSASVNRFSFKLSRNASSYKKVKIHLPLLHYFKFNKIRSTYNTLIKVPTIEVKYKKNRWTFDRKRFSLGHVDLNEKREVEKIILQHIFKINHSHDCHFEFLLPLSNEDRKHYYQQIKELCHWFKNRSVPAYFTVEWR